MKVRTLECALRDAGFDVAAGGADVRQVYDLLAVCLADEHFGYEPDWDHSKQKVVGWYCRGCGQPFGKPHLNDCPHAESIKRVEALRER